MIHKKCQLFTGAGCPDLLSGVETFRRQHRFRRQSESEDGSGNRENTKKKRYSGNVLLILNATDFMQLM